MSKAAKRKVINHRITVKGFNAQVPWFQDENHESTKWVKQRGLVGQVKRDWEKRQRWAVWIGLLFGAGLVCFWLGILYALAA